MNDDDKIIIGKQDLIDFFDKAGDPMALWCMLKANECPTVIPVPAIHALYEDAKKTHRSVHSLTDLAFQSSIQIRLLRKLFPWLESESIIKGEKDG